MNVLSAQSKQDYYWPFGQDQNLDESGVQAFEFDFNDRPFSPKARNGGLNFDQNNASICDKDGNLLFYTNGCAVANRFHEMMPNGDSINSGPFFDIFWGGDCRYGYPGSQNITILPDPSYDEGFYIIHKTIGYKPGAAEVFPLDSLKYTYVDMSMDEGRGDVVNKNINFDVRENPTNYLSVIAHTNANDWWIVTPIFPSGFAVYALTESGIEFTKVEPSPEWDMDNTGASGYSKFSPDGTQYALFNFYDGLQIYDFDRDDASFSNQRKLEVHRNTSPIFSGLDWSPNSRFLYYMKFDSIWQLDTWVDDLSTGIEVISGRAPVGPDPFGWAYGNATLGPDCRIYIRSKSGSLTFHVINKPDELGAACDFVQHGIELPSWSASGSFPNFPRFRVDEEEKCDPSITSMFGDEIFWRRDMTVFPNPARDQITVELPELQMRGQVFIIDMLGQVVLEREAFGSGQMAVDISGLPVGRYSVEYVPEDNTERVVYTAALVVSE